MATPNESLVAELRRLPRVRVQNSLMRMGDRPIALAMMYMEDEDRSFLLSHLPSAKIERIEDELRLQKRLKITYAQYVKAVRAMSDVLASDRAGDTLRSYIRPKKRR